MQKGLKKPLAERWRPLSLDDIVGQWGAVKGLRSFAHTWSGAERPRVRVALLEGPPGTGKTAAAQALANDMGWNLVEMSSSDARNADAMSDVAGRASITNSFTDDGRYLSAASGGRTLVLLDEVDSLPTGSARRRAAAKPAKQSFRDFLTGRYREIAELNKAWGLSGKDAYDSFDEFPKEPSPAGLARYPKAARSDINDWTTPQKKSSSSTDEGAPDALSALLGNTKQPVVLTANDAYPLFRAGMLGRDEVLRLRFLPVDSSSMLTLLQKIAAAEHMDVTKDSLKLAVDRAGGDVRAALNDLEVLSAMGLREEASQVLGLREVDSNLFDTTKLFLSSGRFFPNSEVMAITDGPPEDLLPWIEENIPRFSLSAENMSEGFRVLAQAELQLARANRWRIWALWSYVGELLAGGVSIAIRQGASPGDRPRSTQVDFPVIFRSLSYARDRRWVRDAVVRRLAEYTHMSTRRTAAEILPVVVRLFREPPGGEDERMLSSQAFQRSLAQTLGLGPGEIAYLLDRPQAHPSVQHLVKATGGASREGGE